MYIYISRIYYLNKIISKIKYIQRTFYFGEKAYVLIIKINFKVHEKISVQKFFALIYIIFIN